MLGSAASSALRRSRQGRAASDSPASIGASKTMSDSWSIRPAEDGPPEAVEVLARLALRARREGDELTVDDTAIGQKLDELVRHGAALRGGTRSDMDDARRRY